MRFTRHRERKPSICTQFNGPHLSSRSSASHFPFAPDTPLQAARAMRLSSSRSPVRPIYLDTILAIPSSFRTSSLVQGPTRETTPPTMLLCIRVHPPSRLRLAHPAWLPWLPSPGPSRSTAAVLAHGALRRRRKKLDPRPPPSQPQKLTAPRVGQIFLRCASRRIADAVERRLESTARSGVDTPSRAPRRCSPATRSRAYEKRNTYSAQRNRRY